MRLDFLRNDAHGYSRLFSDDVEEGKLEETSTEFDGSIPDDTRPQIKARCSSKYLLLTLVFTATTLISTILILSTISFTTAPIDTHSSSCAEPSVRREWRNLSSLEQTSYITAVKCLMNSPPQIAENNGSRYEDFAYAHQSYWDWTLDSPRLSHSPIFSSSPTTGFGSNGNSSSTPLSAPVGNGHCVTDGAFANLQLVHYDGKYRPHCLSRGFLLEGEGGGQDTIGPATSPGFVERLMKEETYEGFLQLFERGAHDAVPRFVRGDFSRFTAPNDPIFWLHHTQIDRLWWMWQQRDPQRREEEMYGGKARKDAEDDTATLEDELEFGDLLPREKGVGVKVRDVMSTISDSREGLCYTYI
ncbi:MAG: hypothetical protein Q9220_002274 [cf. Caloplaca sp. 1 TL-2023]